MTSWFTGQSSSAEPHWLGKARILDMFYKALRHNVGCSQSMSCPQSTQACALPLHGVPALLHARRAQRITVSTLFALLKRPAEGCSGGPATLSQYSVLLFDNNAAITITSLAIRRVTSDFYYRM
uniref:Uncharacterized protein n=1 Tax=Pipistrellus kuhlii TaxID=59472 RepID=A0A7J7ZK16_PIPKU|nr:hypothetical protein mPipKuh1_009658 [Pipistrellus kuhlii]